MTDEKKIRKLTKAQVAPLRDKLLKEQGGICPLCELPIDTTKKFDENGNLKKTGGAVLDHDHKTGQIRGVLCWFCNTMEGAIKGKRYINGLGDDDKFKRFLKNLGTYLFIEQKPYHHPKHKTEEEKRNKRNTKAREATKRRREDIKKRQAEKILNKTKDQE